MSALSLALRTCELANTPDRIFLCAWFGHRRVTTHTPPRICHTTALLLSLSLFPARLLRQSVDSQVGSPCQQDVQEAYSTTARRVQANRFTRLESIEMISKTY